MASFVWALLCRRVLIDQGTNAVTYVDAIEGLGTARFPAPAPLIIIASLWRRTSKSESKITVQGRVVDPDGNTVAGDVVTLELQENHKRGRIHIGLRGFTMPASGIYSIVIEQQTSKGWKEECTLSLDVEEIEMPNSAGGVPAKTRSGSRSAKKQTKRKKADKRAN